MAGAISGAYLGLGLIPEGLAHRITDQGTWGFEELTELSRECYRLKCRKKPLIKNTTKGPI
jgi:hypothetical protein